MVYLRNLIFIISNLIIPVNLGILVSSEFDDFCKAGDSLESGCSVDPFDSGEYF